MLEFARITGLQWALIAALAAAVLFALMRSQRGGPNRSRNIEAGHSVSGHVGLVSVLVVAALILAWAVATGVLRI